MTKTVRYLKENSQKLRREMTEEEKFADFITGKDENDFESGEAWYRWQ